MTIEIRNGLASFAARLAAGLCFLSLLLAGSITAQAQSDAAKPATEQEAADSDDIGWPREFKTAGGTVVVYQPQVDELKGPDLSGRAAFSLRTKPDAEPEFGAMWFTARVNADMEERLAHVDNVRISKVALPDATDEQNGKLAKAIEERAGEGAITISLDRLAVALKDAETERKDAEGLDNTPPKIIIKNVPAVLLYIDGKPKLGAVEGSDVLAMENTPFPIVLDPGTKKYYLNGGAIWYESKDVKGPWKYIEKVPQKISSLIKLTDEQKKDLKELIGSDDDDRVPEIIYADVPSELIVIDGKPSFTPLVGADLLYVENSETSVFLDPPSKQYYVLLSGRWYANDALKETGWTYVPSSDLPAAFANIPTDSDRAAVLSQVAGTEQAEDAIAEASIPQVTAISRKNASLKVTYGGEPKFEQVKGTSMEYAVNTSTTVLKIDGLYYAVDQGVWYVSENATGPWSVADEVPDAVDDIPADNPAYNVKYVKVYDSTPEYVYVGYTPGYVGSYIYGGTVVYGTGYHYPSWYGPYFYPRPLTWTIGAFFRPWVGWGYGVGWGRFHYYGGFGPAYGWNRYHRRGWYGPGGYHSHRYNRYRAKHHRASHYRHRNNIYNRPANRNRNQFKNTRQNRKQMRNNYRGAKNRPNNVFTDRKGNVYRKNKNGWQKRDGKGWKNTKLDRNQRPGAGNKRPGDKRPGTLDNKKRPGAGDKSKRPAGAANKKRPANTNKAKKPQKGKAKKRPQQKAKPQKRAKTKQKARPKTQKRKSSNRNRQRNSHNLQRQSRSRNRGAQRSRSHSQARRRPSGGRGGGGRRGGGGGRRR